ncbi:MAG: hypothetical protein WBG19_10460 [Thermoplasmata archaeon]
MPRDLVPQRSSPSGRYSVSAISLALPRSSPVSPSWASIAVPSLRRARALGVTSFVLGGSERPGIAEEAFMQAFPDRDPDLVVIVRVGGASTARPRDGPPERSPPPELPRTDAAIQRLSARYRVLVDWDPPSEDSRRPADSIDELEDLRTSGRLLDLAVRLRPGDDADVRSEHTLRSGPLSLLDVNAANAVRRGTPPSGFAFIARDVFAQGALDGSWIDSAGPLRGPATPPPDMAELHARLDPILRLGFLTQARSRTLAQAALEFVLRWRWVLTAVVPLPAPDRLAPLLRPVPDIGFSEEELARLGVAAVEPKDPRAGSS